MTSALNTLTTLRAAGFTFRDRAGTLTVEPLSKLMPEQLATVKTHRKEFLAILKDEKDEAEWEERTDKLAALAPDVFAEGGPRARLVDAVIVRWRDDEGNVIHEGVATQEEFEQALADERRIKEKPVAKTKAKKKRKQDGRGLLTGETL